MSKLLQQVLLLLVTCFCSIIFAGEDADERKELSFDSKEPLFISLGADCYVAGNLVHIGYRRASFPFDWLLTLDHNGMIKILDDDFKYFLDPSCYSIHTNRYLIHNYYHFEFRHEHDDDLIGKYGRRIERFRRLNNYSGKVFFIRKSFDGATSPTFYWPSKDLLNISFEHALELNQVLKKRFPNLDFSLVIVNFWRDRTTIKVADDIILVNTSEDILALLSKLVKVLPKCAEDRLPFKEGFFLDGVTVDL
ncbi:MAG TPA: DUF1796 family putative cysteine peptidase [Rhabdochlamydiaceae bacterium]|jgi:hypothetical protein|nr:DUF1796 family putative cysteine peptidase [Rhabdochlamydiaceae bacterium]